MSDQTQRVRAASRPGVNEDNQDGRAERTSDEDSDPSTGPRQARDLAPQATPAPPDDASSEHDAPPVPTEDQIIKVLAGAASLVAWCERSRQIDRLTLSCAERLRACIDDAFPDAMDHARNALNKIIMEAAA